MSVFFAVEFEVGFYAKKQPSYNWAFTRSEELAHLYKTKKAAKERGEWGLRLNQYGKKYRIVMIEIVTENRGAEDWITVETIRAAWRAAQKVEEENREVISLKNVNQMKVE